MTRAVAAAVVGAAVVLSGCAQPVGPTGAPAPKAAGSTAARTPIGSGSLLSDCPAVHRPAAGGAVMVDYVDFFQMGGQQYISGLGAGTIVASTKIGPEMFQVRCSFRQLNDATRAPTGAPRDGDSAFLTAGTPVYAVRGWPPRCRLAAIHDGQLHLYLAYVDTGLHTEPAPCAQASSP